MDLTDIYEIALGLGFNEKSKIYHFLNKHSLPVKTGDFVVVKIKTGGTTIGKVERIVPKKNIKSSNYQSILEIQNYREPAPILSQEILEKNKPICYGRVIRNQWNSNSGASNNDWSDCLIKYDVPKESEVKTGDLFEVEYKGKQTKAKIVAFSYISKTSKAKIETLGNKIEKKKGFFAKLFGK